MTNRMFLFLTNVFLPSERRRMPWSSWRLTKRSWRRRRWTWRSCRRRRTWTTRSLRGFWRSLTGRKSHENQEKIWKVLQTVSSFAKCEITSRMVEVGAIKKISSCGKESEQRHLSSCALPPLLQTRDISPTCNRLGFFLDSWSFQECFSFVLGLLKICEMKGWKSVELICWLFSIGKRGWLH